MSNEAEVIILAQGTQQRLGRQHGPKQLLGLPACGGVPIMCRTVRQVFSLSDWWPTIVTWAHVRIVGLSWPIDSGRRTVMPAYFELLDPGNSSLKGIARYLEQRERSGRRYDRTIVLLGDVVYSWACLGAIWQMSNTYGFVGTSDISSGGGELWGVAWEREFDSRMMADLRDALLRHPPFEDAYQPGQLRRWITGWQRGDITDHVAKYRRTGSYVDIDDYTHDIDIPHDLVLLPELSVAAAADDAKHGMSWDGVSWERATPAKDL